MSLEALKSVPCPAGDKCNAFHCLFSHPPRNAKPGNPATRTTLAGAPVQHTTGGKRRDGWQDGWQNGEHGADMDQLEEARRRKRIKLAGTDSSPEPTTAALSHGRSSTEQTREGSAGSDAAMGRCTTMNESGRSVSGMVALAGAGSDTGATGVGSACTFTDVARSESQGHAQPTSGPKPTLSRPNAAGQPPKQPQSDPKTKTSPSHGLTKPQQKKPESLNPRLIRSAPAQHDIRYKLLKLLHYEYRRLNDELKTKAGNGEDSRHVMTEQQVITHALNQEERLATEKGILYTSASKHHIMKYKRMGMNDWVAERVAVEKAKRARDQKKVDDQQAAATTTTTPTQRPVLGPPKVIDTGLTPAQEVRVLKQEALTPIVGLDKHGYVTVAPSAEDVAKARAGMDLARGLEKCDRCETRFQVFPGRRERDGKLAGGGRCKYHSGRAYYPEKTLGTVGSRPERRWNCCSTTVGETRGCTTCQHHVFRVSDPARLAVILPFKTTPDNDSVPDDRAVAFDCEMGYTVFGTELVRLTATAWPTNEILLDVLVRPQGEILDLNSAYSGVWPQDMANAELWTAPGIPPVGRSDTPSEPISTGPGTAAAALSSTRPRMKMVSSPARARELLFSLISPSTPLIGHALENDLNVTRIIHPTIVDTVLLYPHKAGFPLRHGLRALAERHLNRTIQANTGLGHDSAEDARTAGDLVRLRVAEHWTMMQATGWEVDDKGELVDPEAKKEDHIQQQQETGAEGGLTEAFIESEEQWGQAKADANP